MSCGPEGGEQLLGAGIEVEPGAGFQLPALQLPLAQEGALRIEGQQAEHRPLLTIQQQQPHPLAAAGTGAPHHGGAAQPELARGETRFHPLQGAAVIGPVAQQQGPAGAGAEGQQVAAARQHLAPRRPGWQVVEGQAFGGGHHHASPFRQQPHRPAGPQGQIEAPTGTGQQGHHLLGPSGALHQ